MSSINPPILEGTTSFVRDRWFVGDMTALVNITAGQAVIVAPGSSSGVIVATSATQNLYGIALTNANAGSKVTVVARGAVRATATNAMSAGDLVGPSPGGNVQSIVITQISNANVTFAYSSLPRGICVVGSATSGSTVIVDLF